MKPCRILLGCMLASLCLLSGGTWAQVVTEFSAGITAGAFPVGITAGPDGNLWLTEQSGNRIGRITTGAVIAPPTNIPTLQQWALWLLGLLILIVTAGVRLRPRNKA